MGEAEFEFDDRVRRVLVEMHDEIATLRAENNKLRKLVEELYPLADNGTVDVSELDEAHRMMRELGIDPNDAWGVE